ncbi:phosphoribosyltransferase [Streptomyces sp. ME01-24h]|nr:phosphoribosyltransferase [Streptomyces sp. ME19-03-3]MDX3215108.1 phosphoribosyltransferase [Streptomyces sp. ME02-6991-2B]MDX3354911.1 phosphoribosyltransferase [Streptomyces sp. ME01-24h]
MGGPARENLTYEAFGRAVRDLAQTIADDGFTPDVVLSIARGGVFVAGGLAYALDCKNIHLVNVEFYTGVGTTLEMPVMLAPVPNVIDFSDKKVLIADDVADTGKTLKLVRDFCADHVAEVRSAVIYEKSQSLVKCEYVWRRTDDWIDFPWSVLPPVRGAGDRGTPAKDALRSMDT